MSNYQNIYQDLPSRVYRVWQSTKDGLAPPTEDLSVTAMLMAAAAGLAMPFENLKDKGEGNRKDWNKHPAFGRTTQTEYQKSLKSCNEFFKKSIQECDGLKSSTLMQCQKLEDIREAARSSRGSAALDLEKHDVRFALRILRNALAHNNILDVPNDSDQIEKLAFFSRSNWCSSCGRMDGWYVLLISVDAFKQFLEIWFDLLKEPGSFAGAAKAIANQSI